MRDQAALDVEQMVRGRSGSETEAGHVQKDRVTREGHLWCTVCRGDMGVKLRPLVVISPSVLLSLLLQVLQFCFVHHLLHEVFFPPHAITKIFGHVRNEVCYEGLDPKHQVLRETVIIYELRSTEYTHLSCCYLLHNLTSMQRLACVQRYKGSKC